MIRKRHFLILAIVALLFTACATGAEEAGAPAAEPDMLVEEEMAEEAPARAADAAGEGARSTGAPAAQVDVQEQLIIRTGRLDIVVEETEETLDAIIDLANDSGGWVVSSSLFGSDGTKSGQATIRVPVDQFDAIMNQIEEMALRVNRSSTSGEDVTEEYVDLSARLQNLEATAERVRGFLDDARDVEDALAVNQELSRLESEIESLKGRLQYLEQSAAFSTIEISLTPDELSQPLEVGGWRAGGVVRNAVEALISALQGLATIAIWLVVVFLPLLLIVIVPIALIVYLVRRWYYGRRRQEETTPAES
ncbi:MAG: DUF4349 domain-containing protein [Candidatus Promineifilaceae bacterium]|nr:DUF4349 domain-containing protein [Candidatus Promineifilaceae bacterium]